MEISAFAVLETLSESLRNRLMWCHTLFGYQNVCKFRVCTWSGLFVCWNWAEVVRLGPKLVQPVYIYPLYTQSIHLIHNQLRKRRLFGLYFVNQPKNFLIYSVHWQSYKELGLGASWDSCNNIIGVCYQTPTNSPHRVWAQWSIKPEKQAIFWQLEVWLFAEGKPRYCV